MPATETWLLDQEPPPGYVREWTDRVATEYPDHTNATGAAFVFRVGLEWLALPVAMVQEVVEPGAIHRVPHRLGGLLLGVTNIRGSLLLCISFGKMLQGEGGTEVLAAVGGESVFVPRRMLVLGHDGHRVVATVDEVHGLLAYEVRQLKTVPATLDLAAGVFTTNMLSWNDKTVGLLDGELLFYSIGRSLTWIQGGEQI